ncbi:hypothetical protein [Halobacterium bonnevillei]|uniref:Uncharacterized protein n=1 Tax=Halobacterium bonnevillei TaxID=2692200 RepID=A0A6B0SPP8_9EURY|nr:hypothetical protein [Halobacterium bonnevillei]MXR21601.1 hypothetical protein [Halobacterium bonnevillei]
MTGFLDAYAGTDDLNEQYGLLKDEIARLRGRRDDIEFFDEDAVEADVRRLNERVDGDLLVVLANDYGRPRAYRPEGVSSAAQNVLRAAILANKYDDTNDDLNDLRRAILDEHPAVHKVLVAEYTEDGVRYHLPEGSNDATNFVTVREMVGLVDYTTNSFQAAGLSVTY